MELHWNVGAFPQISLAYEYLAGKSSRDRPAIDPILTTLLVIVTGRFSMIKFGAELNTIADLLLARWQDETTSTRAGITYWYASGHLHHHVRDALSALEVVLRRHMIGDRLLALIDIAVIALNKLYASHPLSETEMLCTQSLADFPHVKSDLRGGPLLLGVRQVARALQGKTRIDSPATVLSDDQHDSEAYIASVSRTSSPDRALDHYLSLTLLPLYLYEYYDAAIVLGESRAQTIEYLWSLRATRMFNFYLALSYLAVLRRNPTDSKRHETLDKVRSLMQRIKDWEVINSVNYAAWSGLLKAELSDVTDDTGSAMRDYDMVLMHAQEHGFVLEEALTYELSAGFYLRRGAKRAALVIVREAITAYKRIDAHGKAGQVAEKYAWLLQEYRETRVAEAACQTDFQGDVGGEQLRRLPVDENERRITQDEGEQSRQDRTSDWVAPEAGVGKNPAPGLGIDVIDFQSKHRSIEFEFTQLTGESRHMEYQHAHQLGVADRQATLKDV